MNSQAFKLLPLLFVALLITGCVSNRPREQDTQSAEGQATKVVPDPPKGEWISDKKGCKVWNPNPVPNESVTWSGKCVGGFAAGKGTLQWFKDGQPSGILYTGDMKEGRYHGKGTVLYSNGNKYVGDWVDGKQEGQGKFTWSEESQRKCAAGTFCNKSFEGTFVNNERRCGKSFSTNGDEYDGCLERQANGSYKMIGKTKYQLANASRSSTNQTTSVYKQCGDSPTTGRRTFYQLDHCARDKCDQHRHVCSAEGVCIDYPFSDYSPDMTIKITSPFKLVDLQCGKLIRKMFKDSETDSVTFEIFKGAKRIATFKGTHQGYKLDGVLLFSDKQQWHLYSSGGWARQMAITPAELAARRAARQQEASSSRSSSPSGARSGDYYGLKIEKYSNGSPRYSASCKEGGVVMATVSVSEMNSSNPMYTWTTSSDVPGPGSGVARGGYDEALRMACRGR